MHEHSLPQPADWGRRFTAWLRDLLGLAPGRDSAAAGHAPGDLAAPRAARAARAESVDRFAFHLSGRRVGCLLVHGLTSTPQSLHAFGTSLAEHGIDVEAVLLPGHGTAPEDLAATTWMEWYEEVRAGLDRLRPRCDRLFVCGQSMGGTLALCAAARERVDGVISLAGFVYLRDWRVRFLPLLGPVMRWRPAIGNDIADPAARNEICYDRVSLRTVQQLLALGTEVKQRLAQIEVPALVVQSRIDHVVPPDTADFIYDRLVSRDKEIVRLEHSYHVVSMDCERDFVAERAVRFMRRVAFAEPRRY